MKTLDKRIVLVFPKENVIEENDVYHEKQKASNDNMNILYNNNFEAYREPLGLESIATAFREKEYKVKMFFCELENIEDSVIKRYVDKYCVRFIGISVLFDRHLEHALILAKKLKNDSTFILLGGPFVSFSAKSIMKKYGDQIDAIVLGEGEKTDVDLAECVYEETDFRDIKGICYRDKNGKVVQNDFERKLNLDQLGFPSRDFLDKAIELGYRPKVASIYTSRGCAQRCTFCTGNHFTKYNIGKVWNARSPKHIVDEIQMLVENYNITYIYICDDNFYGYGEEAYGRVIEICRLINERKLHLKFHYEMRVDFVTEKLLMELKSAGFLDILLGIEAGVQTMLDRWKKGVTVEQNRLAINLVRKCGLNLKVGFILYDGDTTFEELRENIRFIKDMELYKSNNILELLNPMQIFNGSQIMKEKYNGIQENELAEDISGFVKSISHFPYKIKDRRVELFWRLIVDKVNQLSLFCDGKVITMIYKNWGNKGKEVFSFVKAYKRFIRELPYIVIELLDYVLEQIEQRRYNNMEENVSEKYDEMIHRYFENGLLDTQTNLLQYLQGERS